MGLLELRQTVDLDGLAVRHARPGLPVRHEPVGYVRNNTGSCTRIEKRGLRKSRVLNKRRPRLKTQTDRASVCRKNKPDTLSKILGTAYTTKERVLFCTVLYCTVANGAEHSGCRIKMWNRLHQTQVSNFEFDMSTWQPGRKH